MKKWIELLTVILALSGLLINVIAEIFLDPVSITRGLSLFKYYTLQSNLIVFLCFMLLYMKKASKVTDRFFGGVVVYISITFVVYGVMLSGLYNPSGWFYYSNLLLHYLVPISVLFYTFVVYDDRLFKFSESLYWVIYPVLYLGFLIVYGLITNDYLYPFFQVSEIGISGLLMSIFGLVIFFFVLSFLVVKILSFTQNIKQR